MEIDPTNRNEVAWTSWLPALGFALGRSTGPVLEVGIGHFSTPFLHEYCTADGRLLVSVEAHEGWRVSFHKEYASPSHEFHYSVPTDIKPWGVAFIDSSPGGAARAELFFRLAPISSYVVVHDYHRENKEAIEPLLNGMNFRVFDAYEPPTLLASKTLDVF